MTLVRQTVSRRMADNRAAPAAAMRMAVSQTDNRQAAATVETMATEIHPVTAEMTDRPTAVAVPILRVVNARTPCIHMSPLVMDGIDYRMSHLTHIMENHYLNIGIIRTILQI
ncbi:hypothetical protein A5692_03300 [Mycobacterium sp. E342]|nr:hypothetical protein A5692_03300 [Mycobacterium sp. E342]